MSPAERASRVGNALGPVLATAALLTLVSVEWAGLWRDPPAGAIAGAVLLGTVPALVRLIPRRWARFGYVASAFIVAAGLLAIAVGANLRELIGADRDVWGRIGDIIPVGLGNAATTSLPLARTGTEPLSALLILVVAGGAALIAWQLLVARRPLPAIIAAATGLAYRWTLVRPDRPVAAGLLTLFVCLMALRLGAVTPRTKRNAPGRAVVAGALIIALAGLGSAGVDRDGGPWWNWRSWTFGGGQKSATLTLQQRYGPLTYPDEPVLLGRLKAERALPLRLVAYEQFDGALSAFTDRRSGTDSREITGTLDNLDDADAAGEEKVETARVTITRTRTPFIAVPGRPREIRNLGERRVSVWDDGTLGVDPALGPNLTYDVDTVIPDPGAEKLVSATIDDATRDPGLFELPVGGGEIVQVPPFGSGQPLPDPSEFGAYEDVAKLSREIIGGAKTPYAAVNRVERYLRSPQNYTYNLTVSRAIAQPELAWFLLETKQGYCQQFAGAMALMLRMNGIPARVAVGLTVGSGQFDSKTGTYPIVDRDAHSWVEVAFDEYGWLPFDPTPGRSAPNSASVSSPEYRISSQVSQIDPEISPQAVDPTPRELREPPSTAIDGGGDASDESGGGVLIGVGLAVGILAVISLIPGLVKTIRRRRRRRGDERAQVLGAARELESVLLDLGHTVNPAASTTERTERVWRELGIETGDIYGMAAEARYAPHTPPSGTGARAWAQLAMVRRSLGWRRRATAGLRLRSLRRR